MNRQSHISATISAATKDKLDRFTENLGLGKDFVVEQALPFFMEARPGEPDEALDSTRFEDEAFDRVVQTVGEPPVPTAALRKLRRAPAMLEIDRLA